MRARAWPPSRLPPWPRRPGWTSWLLRGMFRETSVHGMPGGADALPPDWLDPEMVAGAVRAWADRCAASSSTATRRGFLPLRRRIAASLQGRGVPAHPERNLLTWRRTRWT